MAQSKFYDAEYSPNKNQDPGAIPQDTDEQPTNEDYWLMVARDSFNQADSYFEANIRKDLERNYAHFANRHAPGSKYYSAQYRHRHKGFRPKTRSFVRQNEAAAAISMFSTDDAVHVRAARSAHPSHQISAEINQALLQYRLKNTVPWYLTAIGAYQETLNAGIVISHQYWDYQEISSDIPQLEEDGQEMINIDDEPMMATEYKVVKDTPAIELRPVENVYFSVAADWRDPVGTSPFIIDKIAMTIDEVKEMAMPDKANGIPWVELTESQLLTGVTDDYDEVRRQREGNREDSKDQRYLHRGFDTVWVHRNIIKKDGRDWIFYTLGVHYRLSDPIPIEQDPGYTWLRPGERPYICGFSNIEAHKNYPESLVGLAAKTQQEANEINNQRRDNVALVLNRRYIVRRSAMIDYAGLQRNVPGGVTEADDVDKDIRIEAPPEVTGSSYQEQDRVNVDFDELTGSFSPGSIQSNRQLNETVGGMELLAGASDSLTEYPLRTFVLTWVEPVLKQLIRLEQTYETDGALLNLMGEKLQLWQRYGIDRVTDAWIQGSMNLEVNVGFGSTNPQQRVNRLAVGLNTILGFVPQMASRLDGEEVAAEVLGALGYQGTQRFFPTDKQPTVPQQQDGQITEQDQAKLDQDYTMHMENLQDKQMQREWDAQKHYDTLAEKEKERLLKREINEEQFEQNMAKLQVSRQDTVDKLRVQLREMKLRKETGSGV